MSMAAERERKSEAPARPARSAPSRRMLQRRCACGGAGGHAGECDECRTHGLQASGHVAKAMDGGPLETPAAEPAVPAGPVAAPPVPDAEPPAAEPASAKPAGWIVNDDAVAGAPGQMHKGDFLDRLESSICAAADPELAKAGRSTAGCPYIQKWLGYYRGRDAAQVERAIRKYAPEAAGAASASDYIGIVTGRVERAAAHWAATGEVTGVPDEVAGAGGVAGLLSGAAGALAGILGKARPGGLRGNDPGAVQARLGSGAELESGVRSRMESAFGHNFSRVRVHTDGGAALVSESLNARAFTLGNDVAFGAGEYRPGTIAGEVLLAHELAHVVQQAGAPSAEPAHKGGAAYDELEADADRAAVGAVASAGGLGARALPALRSGLSLQRCTKSASDERLSVCVRPVKIADDDGKNPTTPPSFADATSIWSKCCIDLTVNSAATVNKTDYKTLDESPNTTPTAEESALFAAAGGSGGCISVFVADQFHQGADTGKDVSGGGGTYEGGEAEPKIVAVEGIDGTVIAHEIGHAMGYAPHGPAGSVMTPSGKHDAKVSDTVTASICEQVRKFTSAKGTGKKECKLDV